MVMNAGKLLLWGMLIWSSRAVFADKEGDKCFLDNGLDAVCTPARRCATLPLLLARGERPPLCGFDRNMPVVCCAQSDARAQPPEGDRKPPKSRRREHGKRKRVTSTPTPSTTSGNAVMTHGLNGGKSWEKCQEYSKAVFQKSQVPTLLFEPEEVTQSECISAQGLVTGGDKAVPSEFPHMAALGYITKKRKIDWLCGGSLISDQFVMTAAHCLRLKDARSTKVRRVRLGVLNPWDEGEDPNAQTLKVADSFAHPLYSSKAHYHDIALLKLEYPVTFTAFVRPACLDASAQTPPGDVATATGWGYTEKDEISKYLLKVDLTYQPGDLCNKTFEFKIDLVDSELRHGFVEESMVCAGDQEKNGDTCGGDSGGPLQVHLQEPHCMFSVVGVTSFGSTHCGVGHTPAVYTRVAAHLDWIESVVWPTEESDGRKDDTDCSSCFS